MTGTKHDSPLRLQDDESEKLRIRRDKIPQLLADVMFDEVFFLVPLFFWQTTHIEVVKMCHVFLHLLE